MPELSQLDAVQELTWERAPECSLLTGRAGTGKTTLIRERVAADSTYGVVGASTGISAVNIGATTINSLLRYFDTKSLRDSFLQGHLTRTLHVLAKKHRRLIIEEMSMLDGAQLDILYRALSEANRYQDTPPMGLMLVGDFAQLPPVNASWAFDAACWPHFAAATERLEHIWRQDDIRFIDALNNARAGRGAAAACILDDLGVQWHTQRDLDFDGTTIVPKNAMVRRHNEMILATIPGKSFVVKSKRWGQQRSEWGESFRTKEWGIPPTFELKIGAYVMILSNNLGGSNAGMRVLPERVRASENSQKAEMASEVLRTPMSIAGCEKGFRKLEEGNGGTQSEGGPKADSGVYLHAGGLQDSIQTGPSQSVEARTHIPTSSGDGTNAGTTARAERESSSSERGEIGQSSRELTTGNDRNSLGNCSVPVLQEGLRDSLGYGYANGDCGYLEDFVNGVAFVRLVRTGKIVAIEPVVRDVIVYDQQRAGFRQVDEDEPRYIAEPHKRGDKYVVGQIEYSPVRLAWASTVHKSQGLTLDRAQLDYRDAFFSQPAMLYVALSRCRTLKGLRLVGQREQFVKACKSDSRVKEWL